MQPKPEVAGQCYRVLVDGAQGKLAFDLYAGAGITTVLLREQFQQVVPVEAYPESAAMLGVSPSSVEQFLAGYQGDARVGGGQPARKGPRTVCAALRRGPA
ncbi:MAG: hypothetical protein IPN77_33620 [Sandaracinaceae bacterium]|nr:hypothetical protein [Sandaracinaceae bacterium]